MAKIPKLPNLPLPQPQDWNKIWEGILLRMAQSLEEIVEELEEINDKLPDKAVSATLDLKEN